MNSVFDLIYSCFNQYLFQDAKNNIDNLKYFFDTNPSTMGNQLVGMLIDAIKTYPLESIDEPLFRSILLRSGKSPSEQQEIMNNIVKWKKFSKEQIEPSRKCLQDVLSSVILQRANRLYSNDPTEYIKYIKNLNIQTSDADILKVTSFNQIDINSIVAESNNSVIPSRYSWLNDTFPMGGFERQQLILISMPPGSGKSLYCLSEIGSMAARGYKTLYLAMGDLTYKDQIIRLASQTYGIPFKESALNLGSVFTSMSEIYKDNLDLMIVPAEQLTAEDFRDFLKNCKKKYDVIAVDYDSNFKSNASDNMYLEYGSIYSILVDIAKNMNLVMFCACQPKVGVWNNNVIELSDVGESSRKQHTADIIITRSRIPDNPNNLGVFKIVKSRRGDVGTKIYSIRLNNGRFIAMPKPVFESLMSNTEKREYTESEINMMIQDYSRNYDRIQHELKNYCKPDNQSVSPLGKKEPNPFIK